MASLACCKETENRRKVVVREVVMRERERERERESEGLSEGGSAREGERGRGKE